MLQIEAAKLSSTVRSLCSESRFFNMSVPEVIVKQGWLRGMNVNSILGQNYITFRGIPYAKPPVGNLRFKDPQPPEPWTGTRDATKEESMAAQWSFLTGLIEGSDDCLYLNVSTTSLEGSRPVMVWIHGGGFVQGTGCTVFYSPDYLMQADIVFVSINYRLGVLGFLSLDHEVAPGNYGLKDQVAALKWVKENISQFGGDANNVTIFGGSAGAASVHYHLLSPRSKGLFHKAIMQSAVATNPWANVVDPIDRTRRLLAALRITATDPIEIIERLRAVSTEELIKAQATVGTAEERLLLWFPFGPSVDDKSPEPFLPKSLEELVEEGGASVPTIIGYNSDEGIITMLGMSNRRYADINQKFEKTLPQNLIVKAPSKVPEIAEMCRRFYFQDKQVSKTTVNEYVQYAGDSLFCAGIHAVVEILRKKKSLTYLYRFSYDNPKSIGKLLAYTDMKGTSHADELHYMFHPVHFENVVSIKPNSTERLILDRFIRMWTDFAKTGNPTPTIDELITAKWLPVTPVTKNYLEITDKLVPRENPDEEMWRHWKRMFDIVANQKAL